MQCTAQISISSSFNPNLCIKDFSCPTDMFVTGIFTLIRHHNETAPNADSFVIVAHIFDTYRTPRNLLQIHNNDINTLTVSTLHVNDFLKKPTLSESLLFTKSSGGSRFSDQKNRPLSYI